MREGREAAVEARDGGRTDEVVVQGVDTVNDDHRTQGGDKWRHVQVSDDDTVDQTNHRTDGADNQDHHENGHGRHFREHLVGVFHRLQQGCRDHRREADLAPCGKVSPLGDDEPRHAQRDDNTHGRLSQNVTQVQQT